MFNCKRKRYRGRGGKPQGPSRESRVAVVSQRGVTNRAWELEFAIRSFERVNTEVLRLSGQILHRRQIIRRFS